MPTIEINEQLMQLCNSMRATLAQRYCFFDRRNLPKGIQDGLNLILKDYFKKEMNQDLYVELIEYIDAALICFEEGSLLVYWNNQQMHSLLSQMKTCLEDKFKSEFTMSV